MRLQQFDALKLFAIFMVIWGHCIQHMLSSNHLDETGYIMIYSFHMPLFMMISGFFAISGLKRSFISSIITKTRQLLLPCIISSIIMAALVYIIKGEDFWQGIDFQLLYAFWFLKTAFFCFLLARISYSFGKYKIIAFLATLTLTQIPHIYRIPYFTTNIEIMYPCFVIGVIIKNYWNVVERNYKTIAITAGLIFAAMLIFWSKDFWQNTHAIIYMLKAGEFSEGFYLAYLRIYRIAIGISGSVFFIALFHWCINGAKNKFIDKVCEYGQYTIGIYILQSFILETIMAQHINMDSINSIAFNLIISPIMSVLLLFVCIYLSKIIEKNKYTAFLFLGKKLLV